MVHYTLPFRQVNVGSRLLLFSLVLLFSAVLHGTAVGQTPGAVNPSFNPRLGFHDGSIQAFRRLANNQIIVVGNFQQFNTFSTSGIARLNPDGTVDTSFQVLRGPDGPVQAVEVDANGRYLIAGDFTRFNDTPVKGLVRLNSDGSLDQNFAPNFTPPPSSPTYQIFLRSNGTIVFWNGTTIYRFLASGALDPAFSSITVPSPTTGFAVQSDGRILVGRSINSTTFEVRRYTSTGSSIDAGFSVRTNNPVTFIGIQADGQILLGGTFSTVNNQPGNILARVDAAAGTLDTTFTSPLQAFNANTNPTQIYSIRQSSFDNSFYIVGERLTIGANSFKLLHLNLDGTVFADQTMLRQLSGAQSYFAVEPITFSRLLLGGNFLTVDNVLRPGIVQLTSTGNVDNNFTPGAGCLTAGKVTAVAVQPDEKILVGGRFTSVNGQRYSRLVRLLLDGPIDPSFTIGSGFEADGVGASEALINDIKTQSNGGILVCGTFTRYNGTNRAGFVRLNDAGILDTNFSPTLDGTIFRLAVLPDNRILIAGNFRNVNSTPRNGLARLNADGTLDTTFVPALGTGTPDVQRSVQQPDGRVLVVKPASIFRLNADGSNDNTFITATTDGLISDTIIQGDGRVLICGGFQSVSGTARNLIARLNSDGTLDTGFNPGTAVSSQMNTANQLALQSDGLILVGGTSTTSGNGIVRLGPTGQSDTSFNPGTGPGVTPANLAVNRSISTVNILRSRQILLGGGFEFFDDRDFRGLVTLEIGPICQFSLSPSSAFFPMAGGTGTLNVVVQGGCTWQAGGIPDWITGIPSNGTGTQTFNFTVAANPGAARRAVISIGGQSFTVVQGDACSFTLSPGSANLPFQGGTGTLTITASTPSCQWFALDLPSWILGIPTEGTGTKTFTFSVAPNSGGPRTAVINIGGQTFTVTQASNPCPFTVSPLELDTTGKFSFKSVSVSTNSSCQWRVSSSVSWVSVVGASVRTGPGSVSLAIAPNPDLTPGAKRVGVVSVAGQAVIITQRAGRKRTTIGVQRPGNATFYLRFTPTTGFADTQFAFGTANDKPISGDWDGDGLDSIGIYRNGLFYLSNGIQTANADLVVAFGQPGDVPIAGDWDGDGIDTVGVYRNGVFYLRNSNTNGAADIQFSFGQTGDIPVAGDWNGDGSDSVGIFRGGIFYLRNSNSTGFEDVLVPFGLSSDLPITGDWDGNGVDTIGVYRNGEYYMRDTNSLGPFNILAFFGISGDVPIKGDWKHD